MKNVRILSDDLREYLERYEIGYPFDNIHEMAMERDDENNIFDDEEDDTSDDYLNY